MHGVVSQEWQSGKMAIYGINPFNASCSKLLLFEGHSAILVCSERQSTRISKIKISN